MNQRCYRVIFNRPRGQAIVVGELARTPGHVSSAGSLPARSRWRRCTLPLLLSFTLGWTPGAGATIVADANAPTAQQPSVVISPNGASPLVNIQTPNAAGVSHNSYSRFDVEQAGAILNNSRHAVQTHSAGTIAGNPHLAQGSARVILNEINSSHPTLLRGFIEVAGQAAQVIVANPSGIYVKGGGFINTSGVTLTTGKPQFQNGHLDSYRVTGGIIKVEGEGLDLQTADYTQIFAQAVQLNAAVHAKKLTVTTGQNLIKADNGQATPIAKSPESPEAPEFALDVAKLGGMYAHHIFIVGTENGVGMRNSGILQATAGTVVIDNQGLLSNRGLIDSKTTTVRATILNNVGRGRLYGDQLAIGVTTLNNDQEQVNGVTAAAVIGGRQSLALGAQQINNRRHAKIISTGTLSIGGSLDRQQQAKGPALQLNNESASLEAHGDADLKIDTLNNRDVLFTTREVPLSTECRREMQHDGTSVKVPINDDTLRQFTDLSYTVYDYSRTLSQTEIVQRDPAQLLFGGKVRLSGVLYNDNSQVILGGTLLGSTKAIHNIDTFGTRATIEQTIARYTTTGWFQDAQQGRCFKRIWNDPVTSQKCLQQQTIPLQGVGEQRLPRGGEPSSADEPLGVGGLLPIISEVAALPSPQLPGVAIVVRSCQAPLTLPESVLFTVDANATDRPLVSTDARFSPEHQAFSTQDLLKALHLDTTALPKSLGDAGYEQQRLRDQVIQLTGRRFLPGYHSDAQQQQALVTQGIAAAHVLQLTAGEPLTAAQQAQLTQDIVWPVAQSVTLADGQTLQVLASQLYTRALADTPIRSGSALISAAAIQLALSGDLKNSGTITASGAFSLSAANLTNEQTLTPTADRGLSGHSVHLQATNLNNQQGAIQAQTQLKITTSGQINNTAGRLSAGEQLQLDSGSLSGDGTMSSAGDIHVTLNSDQPTVLTGQLQANRHLLLTAHGELDSAGRLQAGQQLTLRADTIHHQATGVIQATQTRVLASESSQGQLNNRGLIDGQITEIRAHKLNNLGRGLIYGDQLLLGANTLTNDAEQLNGRTAVIAARQQLKIGAQQILNQEGALIISAGPMAVGQQLDAQQQLVGQALELNNQSATIDVHGDADFNISTLNNRDLHFRTHDIQLSSERHREMQREGELARVPIDETSLRQFEGLNYTVYDYYRTRTQTAVAQRNPAKILIGGHLNFSGTLNNYQSQVLLGGTMTGPTQSIHNIDAFGKHTITEHGTTQAAYAQWTNSYFRRVWHNYLPYHAIPESRTIPLHVVVEKRHTPPGGSGVQIAERAELVLQPPTHGQLAPFNPLPEISEVTALACHPISGLAMVIRSSNAPLILPTSGLFTIDASASDRPLISTDPRFINHHSGFSTQHLLQELQLNRAALPRLYGDSFHEQQRLRDQVIELTSHRFLPGHHSDAQQQQALVTQALAATQALQLIPGEPLTAAQQTQLTEAIVWPVAKPVTLATGQTTEVLDPQLYTPIVAHAPISGGAVISASEIRLNLPGALHNSGTLTANALAVTAENIHNQGGTVYGEVNHLTARGDVHNQGGTLGAEQHLRIRAGQDFNTQTATQTSISSSSHPRYHDSHCHTTLDQRAGLYVLQQQGVLEADAGRDITLTAARVLNAGVDGQTRFTAGRDITFGAVQVGEQHQQVDGYHTRSQGSRRDVGSQLKTAGDMSFHAGHDFTALAAQVTSGIPVDHRGAPSLTQECHLAIPASSSGEECLGVTESLAMSRAAPPRTTGSLRATAGNNMDIRVGQASYYYDRQLGESSYAAGSQDALPQEAGLAVQAPQGTLAAMANNDMTLTAVSISNSGTAGKTTLTAGRHLTLGTLHTEQQQSSIEDADNFIKRHRTAEVGSSIQTVSDLHCQAGERFQATAAQVSSRDGALQVTAAQQLELRSGQATEDYDHATKHTEEGFLSSKTIRTRDIRHQSMALGSSFSGRQVTMIAGNQTIKGGQSQLSLQGSSVVGDEQTTLVADTVSITSAENHQQQHYTRHEKKSGLFSTGGASLCIGSQRQSSQQQRAGMTHNSSTVGSLQGNVTVQALEHYHQRASQVVAPQGDVVITAGELAILDAHNQLQLTQESSSHTSGLTVSVSNPALSAVQTAQQLTSAVSQTRDPRMHALAAAAGGLAAKNTVDALKCNPQQLGGVNINATFGSSESHSESREIRSTAQRSQLVGRTVTIQARKGNATIQGEVHAKEAAQIIAAGQLKLLASESQSHEQSSQSSSSEAFGVGRGIVVGMSEGEGSSQGKRCNYQLAQVSAGQKVILQSGGDALVQGEVKARQIQANIDGNLTIESLQDSDHQRGEQRQFGINLDIGPTVSGSVNIHQSDYRRDFKSVQQQAGLKAGDLGFQLKVEQNVHLEGGLIASSEQAVTDDQNQLVARSITTNAIENSDDHGAQSIGMGIGFSTSSQKSEQASLQEGGVGKNQQGQAASGALQVPGSQLPSHHGFSATIPMVMTARGHASSTTYSGISGASKAVTITNPAAQLALTGQTPEQAIASIKSDVTSDQDGSNALPIIFNLEEIKAGEQIVGTLTREVSTFLDHRVKEQKKTQKVLAEEQGKAYGQQRPYKIAALQKSLKENQLWEMGGNGRLLITALTLAASGNVTGSTGQLLQATAVNTLQGLGAREVKLIADSMNSEVARTALQGLLAGAGAAAQGRNATPAALGASASVVLNNLIDSAYGNSSSALSLAEREARKNLVTTLITGTTQALGGDAALANAAATLEMENNYLSRAQWSQRNQELSEGENLLHNAAIRAKWDLIDTGQDASFRAGVIAGIPTTLYEAVEGIVDAALSPHETYLSLKSLFDSDNVLGTVSEAVKQSYIARLDKMDAEFERAGASGSFNAGLESTKLIADIASLAASGIGVAKGGVALTNFGVKAAKQGIQSAKSVRGLATAAKQGTTATVPQFPSKIAAVSDKLTAGYPLNKAGAVAAKPPVASSEVVKNLEKLPWNSWQHYEKNTINGRQYAKIGKRLYSQHAVDRMQPSGLGAPAGAIGAGRNVTPNMVENVIRNGTPQYKIVDGTSRTIYWQGNVGVVTENHGNTVITILRRGGQ